jgi:Fungal Zn(2)-Cys(6) binuclear cluster domain
MNNAPQLLTAIGLGIDSQIAQSLIVPNSGSPALIRKRRNGLQPACEPCRKAKVRCDNSPVGTLCARCKKRKTVSQCVFLNAPMTKQFQGYSSQPRASLPTPKSTYQSSQGRSPSSTATTPAACGRNKAAGPSGFLGSTSFSSTINDHEDETVNNSEEVDASSDLDPAQISMGVDVLKVLPGRNDCQTLLKKYLESPCEVGLLKPANQFILDYLFYAFEPTLEEPRQYYQLEKLSEAITRSSAPIFIPPEDGMGWMRAFTGPNTRWESIGILFSALAYGLLAIPDRDFGPLGVSLGYSDKKKGVLAMKEAVEWCLELCKHSLNTLVCNLLYKNFLLETVLHGDGSKLCQNPNGWGDG